MTEPRRTDPWHALRRFTAARIAQGRAGCALPTEPLLAFSLAHAQARDAVHHPLDTSALRARLAECGWDSLTVHSAASDRAHYLRRPDLGRRLEPDSRQALEQAASSHAGEFDLLFVIGDGLSAFAAERQSIPLLQAFQARQHGWRVGPIVIAEQARVALADEIGALLHARLVVMLIGERPGLSSPDSLGLYLTFQPKIGRTDAERNCISNVRPEGLSYTAAAHKLHYLITQALRLELTGVALKDDSEALAPPSAAHSRLPADR